MTLDECHATGAAMGVSTLKPGELSQRWQSRSSAIQPFPLIKLSATLTYSMSEQAVAVMIFRNGL
jgi:hypothetical protein